MRTMVDLNHDLEMIIEFGQWTIDNGDYWKVYYGWTMVDLVDKLQMLAEFGAVICNRK